jgi:tetratricopeptide (TPR) repeat protein
MKTRGRVSSVLLAFTMSFALLRPELAVAEPAPAEAERQARRSFEAAEAHFRAGLFAEALAEYQAGYDTEPLPGFLINIGQCHRRLGDLRRARAYYRKFILVAPDSPLVPQVNVLIAELDKLADDLAEESEKKTVADAAATKPPVLALHGAPDATADRTSGPLLITQPVGATARTPDHKATTRWWLWGVIGTAVAVAATTAIFAFRAPDPTTLHDGTLATLRR